MKIYLASPFFNKNELKFYKRAIGDLRANEFNSVYVPQEHTIEGAWEMSNANWAKAVYDDDLTAIAHSDAVVALNFGMYSDSGTAWECGVARGLGIPVIQVLCGGKNATYSMMMISSADRVIRFEDLENFWNCPQVDLNDVIQK